MKKIIFVILVVISLILVSCTNKDDQKLQDLTFYEIALVYSENIQLSLNTGDMEKSLEGLGKAYDRRKNLGLIAKTDEQLKTADSYYTAVVLLHEVFFNKKSSLYNDLTNGLVNYKRLAVRGNKRAIKNSLKILKERDKKIYGN